MSESQLRHTPLIIAAENAAGPGGLARNGEAQDSSRSARCDGILQARCTCICLSWRTTLKSREKTIVTDPAPHPFALPFRRA